VTQGLNSLILVTVDCLRADHVGFLGYDRPTTPFLDSLADESLVFRNAIAAGAPTYYSLPAILASRYPLALGRDVLGIAPEENTIASVLREYGFQTTAFSAGNPYISARFGYDQGFHCFRNFLEVEKLDLVAKPFEHDLRGRANQALSKACQAVPGFGKAYNELYFQYCQRIGSQPCKDLDSLRRFPSADLLVDHAIAWLNEHSSGPFFLWLHLMDPHAPYYPKVEALEKMESSHLSAEKARYLNSSWNRSGIAPNRLRRKLKEVIALYDAGIRWADIQIRRLTERLVELNVWDKCAFAVTADHGEEFLDHKGRFHAPLKLTEELIHVPLLLRVPHLTKPRELWAPFGLVDLAPTLLDALGLPAPASFRGRSCWEPIAQGEGWNRPVFTECVHGCTNPFHSGNRVAPRILGVRKRHYKLVMDFSERTEELFDLRADPAECHPLSHQEAKSIWRECLEHARRHLAESQKSRDIECRIESQLRDLRIEWAHSTANAN
jgi:arylsulfatase A-like enzyme